MKKMGFLIAPFLMILLFMTLSNRIMSGSMDPKTMILLGLGLVFVLFMTKSKKVASKTLASVQEEVLKEYAMDAFAEDEALQKKFHAALTDFGNNYPKAAIAKLEKLAPLCTGEKERYAVAMASAKVYFQLQKYKDCTREYNKALVIHPTCTLSVTIGDCYQRLGELTKAQEAYEFAIDLEPQNVDAWSRLATVFVAQGDYEAALDQAMQVLTLDEHNASALATAAISSGLLGDNLMYRHYTNLAVENGYKEDKIKDTVKALKKR